MKQLIHYMKVIAYYVTAPISSGANSGLDDIDAMSTWTAITVVILIFVAAILLVTGVLIAL